MRQTGNAQSDAAGGTTDNAQEKGITFLSVFIDTPTAAPNPETKLFSDFNRDTHVSKVYLAGRGESQLRFIRCLLRPGRLHCSCTAQMCLEI